jgi:hypothetical protein
LFTAGDHNWSEVFDASISFGDAFLQSLWIHRRFLSQWWIQQSLSCEETSSISSVDTFVAQEVNLLRECMNAPSDEFEESRVQAELAALYIIWISKAITTSFNQLALQ